MGDGSKTAGGNKHAEGQANGPGEPRKNQEGEGEQENVEQGAERAGRQARNRPLCEVRTYNLRVRTQVRLRGGPHNHEAAETSTRRA